MSDVFFPFPPRPDLLTDLSNQSQAVRQFAVTEREAGEMLSQLSNVLDPALYQAGGLLNEQILEPFFANPLPDAPLAAALRSQADPEVRPALDEPPFSLKRRKISGESFLHKASAQDEAKTQHQKPQKRKQWESYHAEFEPTASTERQSANSQQHSSKITPTIQQKVTVLQESKTRIDSNIGQQQANAAMKFAGRERKAGAKARRIEKPDALSPQQTQLKAERKNSGMSIESQAISPQQAAEILGKRWKHQAWKSPLITSGKSAQIGLLGDDKNQTGSDQSEMSSRVGQQQAKAVMKFADRGRKAGAKARKTEKPDALSPQQTQLKAERKNSGGGIESQAISPQQAGEILEKKWRHQAWKSPIITSGKSAQIGLPSDDENQTGSGQNEIPLRTTEKQLEQKVAQFQDRKFDAGERRESLDAALIGKPQRGKNLTPDTNEAPQQKSLTDLNREQAHAHAFTPAPSTSPKPEGLVGLRGLAARAAANESAAPIAGSNQGRTAVDQAPASVQGQAPGSAVAQTSSSGPTNNTTRAVSVSELAELIAQEAKRAGINLEQFQP